MSKLSDSMPLFKWELNAGHLLTFAVTVTMLIVYVIRQEAKTAEVERRLIASEQRGMVYVPRLEALLASNQLQDERISNMAAAVAQIRQVGAEGSSNQNRVNTEILSKMGDVRESVARIEARMEALLSIRPQNNLSGAR